MLRKEEHVRKNLLDLRYQKFLQYYNTSLIITFTYVAGLIIAFLTGQVDYGRSEQVTLVLSISTVILAVMTVLIMRFHEKLQEVPREIGDI